MVVVVEQRLLGEKEGEGLHGQVLQVPAEAEAVPLVPWLMGDLAEGAVGQQEHWLVVFQEGEVVDEVVSLFQHSVWRAEPVGAEVQLPKGDLEALEVDEVVRQQLDGMVVLAELVGWLSGQQVVRGEVGELLLSEVVVLLSVVRKGQKGVLVGLLKVCCLVLLLFGWVL